MNKYEASIARACLGHGGIEYFYHDNVPECMAYPSIYFPPAMVTPGSDSLNSYDTVYEIFAQLFERTSRKALELADDIVQGIMKDKCKLPVYDVLGNDTGEIIKIQPPSAHIISEGVAQITLEYSVIRPFKVNYVPSVKDIGINQHAK